MGVTIRPGRLDDSATLAVIERAASERFRDVGYPNVADDEPFSADELAAYMADGRCWVAAGDDDVPIGYLVVDVVDGNAHIEQVSVHPDHQGLGLGRALVDEASAWARRTERAAVTLTTYADVPWNRPLYEHLGFAVMAEGDIGPALRTLRGVEASHGLDPARRVCMRLAVSS